jgi:hypothetical protein
MAVPSIWKHFVRSTLTAAIQAGFAKGLADAGLTVESQDDADFTSDAPKLLTCHSAKGLTFDSSSTKLQRIENCLLKKIGFDSGKLSVASAFATARTTTPPFRGWSLVSRFAFDGLK